jgi:hypothetical protein
LESGETSGGTGTATRHLFHRTSEATMRSNRRLSFISCATAFSLALSVVSLASADQDAPASKKSGAKTVEKDKSPDKDKSADKKVEAKKSTPAKGATGKTAAKGAASKAKKAPETPEEKEAREAKLAELKAARAAKAAEAKAARQARTDKKKAAAAQEEAQAEQRAAAYAQQMQMMQMQNAYGRNNRNGGGSSRARNQIANVATFQMMRQFDANGNGRLDPAEMKAAQLAKPGRGPNDQAVRHQRRRSTQRRRTKGGRGRHVARSRRRHGGPDGPREVIPAPRVTSGMIRRASHALCGDFGASKWFHVTRPSNY